MNRIRAEAIAVRLDRLVFWLFVAAAACVLVGLAVAGLALWALAVGRLHPTATAPALVAAALLALGLVFGAFGFAIAVVAGMVAAWAE